MLGLIQGVVCPGKQPRDGLVSGQFTKPHTTTHGYGGTRMANRFSCKYFAEAADQNRRTLQVGIRQQQREFFAANAADDILLAKQLAHQVTQVPDHGITRLVAVGIVDLLEVVDIDDAQRHGTAVLASALDFLLCALKEAASIAELGQRIFGGQRPQLCFQLFATEDLGPHVFHDLSHLGDIAFDGEIALDLAIASPARVQGHADPVGLP